MTGLAKGCLDCPYMVSRCSVSLRSCSLSKEGSGDSCLMVECRMRPELGLFEPQVNLECYAHDVEGAPVSC